MRHDSGQGGSPYICEALLAQASPVIGQAWLGAVGSKVALTGHVTGHEAAV